MPDVALWTDCNQACAFCSNPGGDYRSRSEEHSLEALKARLGRHREGRQAFAKFDEVRDYFTLTGGEPTLHPEFFAAVEYIRREFPRRELRLLTNGRSLAGEPFAARLLQTAGTPFETAVLFCGPDAATHERIAGAAPGSFQQTVRGVDQYLRLRTDGQRLELRVILTALQMPSLEATLSFLSERFPEADRLVLIFAELEGRALWRLEELRMPMAECARRLDGMFALLEIFREARLYHFTPCVLAPRLWPFLWNTLDEKKVVHAFACRDCPTRSLCGGIHKSYARHVGVGDFAAIREPEGISRTGSRYHPVEASPVLR